MFLSEPKGSDIYVDEKFVGTTPSMLPLAAGTHLLRIETAKFKPWTRTIEATASGKITVQATLEPQTSEN